MAKKKLIALGLIAIMALGQSGSVFAAEYYTVTDPAYAGGYVSGTCQYRNTTSSNSYDMQDTVTAIAFDGSRDVTYKKSGYGINVATVMCQVGCKPREATNEGFKKVNYVYVSIDKKSKTW